jgi:rhodanese-related sulfurtransferase
MCAVPVFPAQERSAAFSSATSVPESSLIQPEALVQLLKGGDAEKLLILQVGSRVMFAQAHIPGSDYAGPGSQAAGIQSLENTVASLPKDKQIVLYCGCCPWNRCPNIGPAYKRLHDLGFTNVKVLYIANNFGDDWVNKGYPAVKGK